jgi:membrane carboxypeptidase/penicillin-binding protein
VEVAITGGQDILICSKKPAGKTGTTQNQSDGWFIMVPNLVTGLGRLKTVLQDLKP